MQASLAGRRFYGRGGCVEYEASIPEHVMEAGRMAQVWKVKQT